MVNNFVCKRTVKGIDIEFSCDSEAAKYLVAFRYSDGAMAYLGELTDIWLNREKADMAWVPRGYMFSKDELVELDSICECLKNGGFPVYGPDKKFIKCK